MNTEIIDSMIRQLNNLNTHEYFDWNFSKSNKQIIIRGSLSIEILKLPSPYQFTQDADKTIIHNPNNSESYVYDYDFFGIVHDLYPETFKQKIKNWFNDFKKFHLQK